MRKKVLIGIDAGSTHLKAAVYALDGTLLDIRHCRVNVYHETPEFSAYNAEEIFSQLCRCLSDLLCPDYDPVAAGISSFGESVVPVDFSGNALSNMIAWYDMRGQKNIQSFSDRFGTHRLSSITGQSQSGKFTLAKLLWMKEHQPELFAKVRCFLFMQDYLSFRLTGSLCTEYSLASRSMLYDIAKKEWSREILRAADLSADYLPRVIPSGSVAGTVSPDASRMSSLPAGIPIVLAGHDHASASIAAGIASSELVMDSLGTSETSVFASDSVCLSETDRQVISFYPYYQGRCRFISSIQGCGFSIEWAARLLFDTDIYSQFFQNAETGLELRPFELPLFVPYLRGLQECRDASGSFIGIKEFHGRPDFCASVLEGLCFEHKRRVLQAERAIHTAFSTVRVSGRLSQYPVFMQLKADVLQKKVEVLSQPEAVSLGAAILAGKACGCLSSWTPTTAFCYQPQSSALPYQERYLRYSKTVEDLLRQSSTDSSC